MDSSRTFCILLCCQQEIPLAPGDMSYASPISWTYSDTHSDLSKMHPTQLGRTFPSGSQRSPESMALFTLGGRGAWSPKRKQETLCFLFINYIVTWLQPQTPECKMSWINPYASGESMFGKEASGSKLCNWNSWSSQTGIAVLVSMFSSFYLLYFNVLAIQSRGKFRESYWTGTEQYPMGKFKTTY